MFKRICEGKLRQALSWSAAVAILGARQVGKTTLQQQLIDHLITEKGVEGNRILRVQFDELPSLRGLKDPVLTISRWFENRVLGSTFNSMKGN